METKSPVANDRHNLPYLIKVLFHLLQQIGFIVIGGFIAAVGLLFLFAELTEDIFSSQFSTLDNNFELWLHSQSNPFLDVVFNFFSTIGGLIAVPIMTAIVFGFLVWQRKFYWAWLTVIALAGGMAMNEVLKIVFQRPRPELWIIRHQLTSYSYPSGHATASFCFFGLLAWIGVRYFNHLAIKVLWLVLMIFIILMVGLSRIYLGAHYPTDVIGGWLSSALWLAILLNSGYFLKRMRQKSRKSGAVSDVTNKIEQG